MPAPDGSQADHGAVPGLDRDLGSGATLASLALILSAGGLGLNSIAVSRIEGAGGAGLIALATQFILLATLVAGSGLRTSVAHQPTASPVLVGRAVRRETCPGDPRARSRI